VERGHDIAAAIRRLADRDSLARREAFPIATKLFSTQRRKDALKARHGRRTKHLIRPENATQIIDALPREAGDELHAVVCGDFVFCDLIAAIAVRFGPALLEIATLSMSRKNVDALHQLIAAGHLTSLRFVISHYFRSTSKEIFGALEQKFSADERVRIAVTRSHCKIALFRFASGQSLTIEGSANLRSSNNYEQLSIFTDTALHEFYRGWFDDVFALPQ
jgi:hypothetical protein